MAVVFFRVQGEVRTNGPKFKKERKKKEKRKKKNHNELSLTIPNRGKKCKSHWRSSSLRIESLIEEWVMMKMLDINFSVDCFISSHMQRDLQFISSASCLRQIVWLHRFAALDQEINECESWVTPCYCVLMLTREELNLPECFWSVSKLLLSPFWK